MGKAEPLLAWCDAKDCSQSSMDITEMLAKNGAPLTKGISTLQDFQRFSEMQHLCLREAKNTFQLPGTFFIFLLAKPCVIWMISLNLTSRVSHPGTVLANTADDLEMQRDGKPGESLGLKTSLKIPSGKLT
jgi:hypothetical protein